jgi:hypothetical protein
MSRRGFVRGVIPGTFVGLTATLSSLTRATILESVDTLIRHRASAARVGRRYLATLPAGTDKSRLLAMSPAIDVALRTVRRQPAHAAGLLQQGITDDFRRTDITIVDGWVLAATEARLCAVVALS